MEKGQVIITGATGGIGSASVRAMAERGFPIIMACRNLEKGEKLRQTILKGCPAADLQLEQVDMASLQSVHDFVERLKNKGRALEGIFNNAGTISRDFVLTDDGLERTVAVNYVAPYYLTRALSPLLLSDAHVVNMVSVTCRMANVDRDFFCKTGKDFRQLRVYADSKLALLLFAVALSQRLSSSHVNLADPGVVNTNMISMGRWFDPLADVLFRPLCKSPEKGADPAVNALTTNTSLRYFSGSKFKLLENRYLSNQNTEWLWVETEEVLRQKGFRL